MTCYTSGVSGRITDRGQTPEEARADLVSAIGVYLMQETNK